jgi:antitoxin component YwqK of YwqJK toxin-antitoxin module
MKFRHFFLSAIFPTISLIGGTLGEIPVPVATQLRVRVPEWRTVIARKYDGDANPAEVIFFEEEEGVETPVKKITMYPTGKIQEESDLTLVNGDVVFHGVSVAFTPIGELDSLTHYDKGLEHGIKEFYYPGGQIKESISYFQGKKHGLSQLFFESGVKKEERQYVHGDLQSEVWIYYPSGKRFKMIPYEGNLIHGEYLEWHENGTLKCRAFYDKEKLQSKGKYPAVTKYDEYRTVIEVQEFEEGIPVGVHCSYYSNGQEKDHLEYKEGQFHGTNRAYGENGDLLAEGSFDHNTAIGKHWRKFPNGRFSYIAQYNNKGKLKEPIFEYNENGQCVAQYKLEGKNFVGEYKEWYPSGQISKIFFYADGKLSNQQVEFHENGKPKSCFIAKEGQLDGKYEAWFDNGGLAKKATYKNGQPEDDWTEWHENGELKVKTFFKNGKVHGPYEEWSQKRVTLIKAHYDQGERHGHFEMWDENSDLLFDATYIYGKPAGLMTKNLVKNQPLEMIEFQDGKKHGKYLEFWDNGTPKVKAFYQNDLPEGLMQGWFADGRLAFNRFYKGGTPVGEQKEYYPTQMLIEKDREQVAKITNYNSEGKLESEQRTYYRDGTHQTVISYEMGELHGMKARWDEQGNLLEEAWYEKGKLEGRYFEVGPGGRELVYFYEKNKKEGPYDIFYREHPRYGKIKALSATYRKGKIEGEVIEYNETGSKISTVNYKEGKKDGPALFFDTRGLLVAKSLYKGDVRNGQTIQYFPNGRVYKVTPYLNDLEHGEQQVFFVDGTLSSSSEYLNGKLSGVSKAWNEEGVLIFEGEYKEGLRHGKFNKYYDSGTPRIMQSFENDQIVGIKKTFDPNGNMKEVAAPIFD